MSCTRRTEVENHEKNMNAQIAEIVERFDFEKMHKVMLHLDWTWGVIDELLADPPRTPTPAELKSTAHRLLRHLVAQNLAWVSQGAFHATYDAQNSYLRLNFVVEYQDSDSCPGEEDEGCCGAPPEHKGPHAFFT
jgi:hypothetical protein